MGALGPGRSPKIKTLSPAQHMLVQLERYELVARAQRCLENAAKRRRVALQGAGMRQRRQAGAGVSHCRQVAEHLQRPRELAEPVVEDQRLQLDLS